MITTIFEETFGTKASVQVKSPGRINLIGEHTDYNEGFVLPAAIDRFGNVAGAKRDDNLISLYAKEFNETFEVAISDIKPIKDSWTNYVLGAVDQLIQRNLPVGCFNMVVSGEIPAGACLT